MREFLVQEVAMSSDDRGEVPADGPIVASPADGHRIEDRSESWSRPEPQNEVVVFRHGNTLVESSDLKKQIAPDDRHPGANEHISAVR